MIKLNKSTKFEGVKGPLLTIVMDGVGIAPDNGANAIAAAHTPTLDMLMEKFLWSHSGLTVRPSVCPVMTIWVTPR